MKTRWYKEAVVYQIYPFSFMDGNNDGMGDIKGIMSKLDYLQNLGINAIWFSPLYESPNKDYGYDISDYYKISPAFGTNEEFKELIDACHKRGIRVIMDTVFNHTSNEHPWFKDAISNPDSPYRDYYIFRKGVKNGISIEPPNNWTSVFTGSAWEKVPGSQDDFYLHLFTKEQPDLNWDNPKVREEVARVFAYYCELGVDGFRMDVFNVFSKVAGLPMDNVFASNKGRKYYVDGPHMHEYLHELNEKVFSKYDTFVVGESFAPSKENAMKYVDEKSEEIDAIFNFAHLQSDCRGTTFLRKRFNLKQFKDGISNPQRNDFGKGWNTLVLENHDNPRSISRFGINANDYRYEAATMLPIAAFLGWGTPFIYEGEEIGMTDCLFSDIDECKDPVSHFVFNIMKKLPISEYKRMIMISEGARDNARTPMQWSSNPYGGFSTVNPWMKINPNYKTINVEDDLKSERSIYRFYQKVIGLKKSNKTAIYGDFLELNHQDNDVYSYLRTLGKDHLFVLANFRDREAEYKIPKKLFGKELKPVLSNYADVDPKDSMIVLAPYQATVYEFED